MEFTFSLNTIFPSELGDIVKVGQDLVPVGSTSVVRNMFYHVRQRVGEIIDVMGEASATAQNLRGPITSGNKLKSHGDHIVYLLVERVSETGRGAVVGLLKIGKKRLVLSNRSGQPIHVYPTCILDFYIHESHQRTGCGKKLLHFMLRDLQGPIQKLFFCLSL